MFLLPLAFLACKTPSQTAKNPPAATAVKEPAAVVEEPVAGAEQEDQHAAGYNVSQELHDRTLAEVQLFIDNLNVTIRNRNFDGWRAALSDEFFARISSPEFLRQQNETPSLKARNIVLKSPNDYFLQVVVPSRANSQVDDIVFNDDNNVIAYYLETRTRRSENNESYIETRRLRIYELTKTGNEWKIKS